MAKKKKSFWVEEPNIGKVVNAANQRGMFVLRSGTGIHIKYEYSCRTKGSWVFSYYPIRKFWTAVGGRSGNADTYLEAMEAAMGGRRRPLSPFPTVPFA